MGKRKRDSDEEEEESAVESGVGTSEDESKKKKQKKKAKPEKKVKPSSGKGKAKAETEEATETAEVEGIEFKVKGGESFLELSLKGKKRVTVRKFKGTTFVDIREYYEDRDSGEQKPGKKGVALTADEWHDIARLSSAISVLVAGNEG